MARRGYSQWHTAGYERTSCAALHCALVPALALLLVLTWSCVAPHPALAQTGNATAAASIAEKIATQAESANKTAAESAAQAASANETSGEAAQASIPAADNASQAAPAEATAAGETEAARQNAPAGVSGNGSEESEAVNTTATQSQAVGKTESRGAVEPSKSASESASKPASEPGAGKPAAKAEKKEPPLPGSTLGWSGYFQAIGSIFLILAVLGGGFYLLKRFGPRAVGGGVFGRGTLQLEAQLPLGPRRSVAVVRFLNKRLVLGVTDSNITLLTETETDDDDEVPEHTPSTQSGTAFSKMLAKARSSRS